MREEAERTYQVYLKQKSDFNQEVLNRLIFLKQFKSFPVELSEKITRSEQQLIKDRNHKIKQARQVAELQKNRAEAAEKIKESALRAKELAEQAKTFAEEARLLAEKGRKTSKKITVLASTIAVIAIIALGIVWHLLDQNKKNTQSLEIANVAKEKAIQEAELSAEKERQQKDSTIIERDRALNQKKITEKALSDLKNEQRQKFQTEAEAARKENRYPESLRAYQEVLKLTANPAEAQIIRKQISETERERNDYEFQRNKDIGLAMKDTGDCEGALVYLEKAAKSQDDPAVKNAIAECLNTKN